VFDQRTFDCLCRAVLNRDEGADYAFSDFVAEHGLLPLLVRGLNEAAEGAAEAWEYADGRGTHPERFLPEEIDAAYEFACEAERGRDRAWRLYAAVRFWGEPADPDTPDF
jgi:hypothetical protein